MPSFCPGQTLDEVDRLYGEYEFNSALQSIYRFFWNDLCDWYVENSRAGCVVEKENLLAVQDICLRQVYFCSTRCPFITEEL